MPFRTMVHRKQLSSIATTFVVTPISSSTDPLQKLNYVKLFGTIFWLLIVKYH